MKSWCHWKILEKSFSATFDKHKKKRVKNIYVFFIRDLAFSVNIFFRSEKSLPLILMETKKIFQEHNIDIG